ncbi:hypothetical protein ACOMHN_024974 [Nucella lapillus]
MKHKAGILCSRERSLHAENHKRRNQQDSCALERSLSAHNHKTGETSRITEQWTVFVLTATRLAEQAEYLFNGQKSLCSQPQDLRNKQNTCSMDRSLHAHSHKTCGTSRIPVQWTEVFMLTATRLAEQAEYLFNGQKSSCSQPQDLRNKQNTCSMDRSLHAHSHKTCGTSRIPVQWTEVFMLTATRLAEQAEYLINGQKSSCSQPQDAEQAEYLLNGQKSSCSQPQDLRNKQNTCSMDRSLHAHSHKTCGTSRIPGQWTEVFMLTATRLEEPAEYLFNGQKSSCSQPQDLRNKQNTWSMDRSLHAHSHKT